MKKICLSLSFATALELSGLVRQLVDNHDPTPVTGARAGGKPLRDRIFRQIHKCDGLIALRIQRDELANDAGFEPADRVRDKLNAQKVREWL